MSDDSTRALPVKALQQFWLSDHLIFEEWKIAKLIPLPKRGDTHLPKNWRTIALQDVLAMVLAKVLAQRIQAWAETNISESQNGFRRHRGTTETLFCVTQTITSRRRYGLQTWAVFADLKSAFDTVSTRGLAAIMRRYGFPNKIINIVNRLHEHAYFEYRLDNERRTVKNNAGVRQGDTAAPILFILAMNAAIELCKWPPGGTPISIAHQGWRDGNDTSNPRQEKMDSTHQMTWSCSSPTGGPLKKAQAPSSKQSTQLQAWMVITPTPPPHRASQWPCASHARAPHPNTKHTTRPLFASQPPTIAPDTYRWCSKSNTWACPSPGAQTLPPPHSSGSPRHVKQRQLSAESSKPSIYNLELKATSSERLYCQSCCTAQRPGRSTDTSRRGSESRGTGHASWQLANSQPQGRGHGSISKTSRPTLDSGRWPGLGKFSA